MHIWAFLTFGLSLYQNYSIIKQQQQNKAKQNEALLNPTG